MGDNVGGFLCWPIRRVTILSGLLSMTVSPKACLIVSGKASELASFASAVVSSVEVVDVSSFDALDVPQAATEIARVVHIIIDNNFFFIVIPSLCRFLLRRTIT